MINFYYHESCGQCAPCRYGTDVIKKIVDKIYKREAKEEELELIIETAQSIMGKTICPFGDAVGMAVGTLVKKFKDEFLNYLREENAEG